MLRALLNRLSPKGLMTALTGTCGLKKRLYRMFPLIFNGLLPWITFSTLTAHFIYRIAPYNFLYTRYHLTVLTFNIPSSSPLLLFIRSLFDYDSLPYYYIFRHPTRSTYFLTHCDCDCKCYCDWFNPWELTYRLSRPCCAVLTACCWRRCSGERPELSRAPIHVSGRILSCIFNDDRRARNRWYACLKEWFIKSVF